MVIFFSLILPTQDQVSAYSIDGSSVTASATTMAMRIFRHDGGFRLIQMAAL
jgi:hypothetical protein